jgi:hypothetical protein
MIALMRHLASLAGSVAFEAQEGCDEFLMDEIEQGKRESIKHPIQHQQERHEKPFQLPNQMLRSPLRIAFQTGRRFLRGLTY